MMNEMSKRTAEVAHFLHQVGVESGHEVTRAKALQFSNKILKVLVEINWIMYFERK